MNPASKSKSKEMPSPKAAKEQQKAYDPLSGRFHTLDETAEHSADYDSLSNNGSSSGESEDHKDKPPSTTSIRQETVPVSDNDKREKIRQQNEKKHQRQRERRAQELHERCTGYLMSRKLESLSQQLVAMGISPERATLALMLNQGRLEESVNWLFEVNEEEVQQRKDVASGSNLKLDISEELARVAQLVVRYKCSKQEVERAVVACEGDLERAEETLRSQKPDPPIVPPKPEELPAPKHHQIRPPPEKPAAATITAQPSRSENNNSNRAAMGTKPLESRSRNLQPTKTQSNLVSEKRWTPAGSSAKVAAQPNVGGGNEGRSMPVREPVIMMQRPQSMNIKQSNPVTKVSAYANKAPTLENLKPKSKVLQNQSTGGYVGYGAENLTSQHRNPPQPQTNRNIGPEKLNAQPYYPQMQFRSHASGLIDSEISRLGPTLSPMGVPSPSLNIPSSLGLFSGWGSTVTPGCTDWNERNGIYSCDYNTIDWTSEWTTWTPKASRLVPGPRNVGASGMLVAGFRNAGLPKEATAATSGAPHEWTSPFAGTDIFSLPRQFVTSPSP